MTCGRPLDVPADLLSADCGGDCWGCVGEAEFGDPLSAERIADEIRAGLRLSDGTAKPVGRPVEKPEPLLLWYQIIALIILLAMVVCITWLIYDLSQSTDL